MYLDYFGLTEKPFSITPDPDFLYLSSRHAEALAHLVYGVSESDGFIQLTGEVGTGKTTLTRRLLKELPEHVNVALILNSALDVDSFLLELFQELSWPLPKNTDQQKHLIDALNKQLLKAHGVGKRTVLMIDEAQNLSTNVLEQLRLLTNLETHKRKLLQIILVGQPELREVLIRKDLRQLAQRVTARYHLTELNAQETAAYIQHRLQVAGATRPIFKPSAIRWIHKKSGGIPRLINVICDRALLGAYTNEQAMVGWGMANTAANQVLVKPKSAFAWKKAGQWAAVAGAVLLVGGALFSVLSSTKPNAPAISASNLTQVPASFRSDASPQKVRVSAEPIKPSPFRFRDWDSSTDLALSTLFNQWQATYSPNQGNACTQAKKQGLQCAHITGAWQLLKQLNRPVILQLVDANGQSHQMVMSAWRDQQLIQLQQGQTTQWTTQDAVSPFWQGEALVLWRPFPGTESILKLNDQGPGVAWLRHQLAILMPNTTASSSTRYDQALRNQVLAFQRQQGLQADGEVGYQTLITLNTLLKTPNTPILTQTEQG